MIELYTDRLKIRTLRSDDWPIFLALHADEELNRYIRPVETLDQIQDKFSQCCSPWSYTSNDWLSLVIEVLSTGECIGITGLKCEDYESGRAEVGYMLAASSHNKGYASESLRALIDWGCVSLNIHKFVAFCVAENLASGKVLEKCGFECEGLLREHYKLNQNWHDEKVFGLLASDW